MNCDALRTMAVADTCAASANHIRPVACARHRRQLTGRSCKIRFCLAVEIDSDPSDQTRRERGPYRVWQNEQAFIVLSRRDAMSDRVMRVLPGFANSQKSTAKKSTIAARRVGHACCQHQFTRVLTAMRERQYSRIRGPQPRSHRWGWPVQCQPQAALRDRNSPVSPCQ